MPSSSLSTVEYVASRRPRDLQGDRQRAAPTLDVSFAPSGTAATDLFTGHSQLLLDNVPAGIRRNGISVVDDVPLMLLLLLLRVHRATMTRSKRNLSMSSFSVERGILKLATVFSRAE
jgi:hypothetical protein